MSARLSPRWPRAMHAARAAEYAGFTNSRAFLTAVQDGRMPPPFSLCGADAWDINDLDAAIDALKAGASRRPAWRERAPARV